MAVIDNLVAYYSLEEASGTREDAHTTNHDLTDNNTVTSGTGKVGTAASFARASSESLSVADHADFSGPGDISIACWIKPTAAFAANYRIVVSKDDHNTQREYDLVITNDNQPNFEVLDSASGSSLGYTDVITSDVWSFLIATYTQADKIARMYLNDGVEGAGAALTNGMPNTTAALVLGGGTDGSGNPYDGLLDEVAIWRKVLTSGERTWLYNSGNGRSYADLVAESGSAALTGTAIGGITETDIAVGGKTIIATLTGTTWIVN